MAEQIDITPAPPDAPSFEGWTCPAAAARQPDRGDGPRRWRCDVRRAGRARLPAELQPTRRSPRSATPPCSTSAGGRLAFSTDSFVVRPLFFPGGSIGDLAVNGTVNDLAMSGADAAVPVGGVHPRGGHRPHPGRRRSPSGSARRPRGRACAVVTGDTKVVESGHGDGVYVNTAGIGRGARRRRHPARPRPRRATW